MFIFPGYQYEQEVEKQTEDQFVLISRARPRVGTPITMSSNYIFLSM